MGTETLSSPTTFAAARPPRRRSPLMALGLQAKLVLGFSALMLTGMVLSNVLFVAKGREAFSDILGEQARQLSQTLAMAAESRYLENDHAALAELGRDLLRSRNIVLVVFSDDAGRHLASATRDGRATPGAAAAAGPAPASADAAAAAAMAASAKAAPGTIGAPTAASARAAGTQGLMQVHQRSSPELGDYLEVTAPVMTHRRGARPGDDLKLLGYITVGVSQTNEHARVQRVSLIVIGVGGLIFVVSLPLASGLVHRIFLPIRQLVAATGRIARGDYDAHVATDRPDEIGTLARSFNDMVQCIREHQQMLRQANDDLEAANRELEAKVHERTRQLESTNARLSSEIAEKEDFLRAVSHDLNAPLRNIGGMAAMLLMKYRDRFDEDVVHRLERIRRNVEVETDLIAELLELSRIKTRRQKMEVVDVGALVEELRGLFDEDLRQRGIELAVETAPLPRLLAERSRLRQLFQNLIDNAIKYMGDGPVRRITIGHRLAADGGGGGVEFHVSDTGVGIEAEDLPRIFCVFRRGRNSADANVPGKGVGLASVKSIVETYDGRIRVESKPGAGTTFRFTVDRRFLAPPEAVTGAAVTPAAPAGAAAAAAATADE